MSKQALKVLFRKNFKVVPGGPTTHTRGKGAIEALDAVADEIDTKVATINGEAPDENGNLVLPAPSFGDLTGLPTDNQPLADALGAKADLVNGLVPASQLPSYVDDVLSFPQLSAFPTTGETGKIYIAENTGRQYRWSTSGYALLSDSGLTVDQLEGLTGIGLSASNKAATQADLKAIPVNFATASQWQANRQVPTNGLYKIDAGNYYFYTRGTDGYFSPYGLRTSIVGSNRVPAFSDIVSGNFYPLVSSGTGTKFLSDNGSYLAPPTGTPSDYDAVKASIYGRFNLGGFLASTAYKKGDEIIRPDGLARVAAKADFTTAGSYADADWTVTDAVLTLAQANVLTSAVVGYNATGVRGFDSIRAASSAGYPTVFLNKDVTLSQSIGSAFLTVFSNGATIHLLDGIKFGVVAGSAFHNTYVLADGTNGTGSFEIVGGTTSTDPSDGVQFIDSQVDKLKHTGSGNVVVLRGTSSVESLAASNPLTAYLYDLSSATLAGDGNTTLISRRPEASGGSGTLATGTYTAQNAGAQTITSATIAGLAQATQLVSVGVRGTTVSGDPTLDLLPSSAFSFDASSHTLTVLAVAGIDQGNVLEVAYLTGAAPGAGTPAPAPAAGIDYANPVTLTAAATLAVNKAYHVTGSGYPLTLPDVASASGGGIFIEIAPDAVGLFPLANGSTLSLYAGETMLLRATPSGWKRAGGDLLSMSARLETQPTQQNGLPAGQYSLIPFTSQARRAGPPGLVASDNSGFVVQRSATGGGSATVILQNATVNGQYFLIIGQGEFSQNPTVLASAYAVVANNGFAVGNVTLPDGPLAAGTKLYLAIYCGTSASLLGGSSNICYFTFKETI